MTKEKEQSKEIMRELEILRRTIVEVTHVFENLNLSQAEMIKLISMIGKKMVQMDDKLSILVKDKIGEGLITKKN